MYGKLWLVWRKRKKILNTGRFQGLKHTCRLEEYLSPAKKKEELVELTEKAHELALELTGDSEPISLSDVVYAKLVTKDGTIPNPINLHSD